MTRLTASRRARNSASVITGGRRRPAPRPSRRRCFLASSRVEPRSEVTSPSRPSRSSRLRERGSRTRVTVCGGCRPRRRARRRARRGRPRRGRCRPRRARRARGHRRARRDRARPRGRRHCDACGRAPPRRRRRGPVSAVPRKLTSAPVLPRGLRGGRLGGRSRARCRTRGSAASRHGASAGRPRLLRLRVRRRGAPERRLEQHERRRHGARRCAATVSARPACSGAASAATCFRGSRRWASSRTARGGLLAGATGAAATSTWSHGLRRCRLGLTAAPSSAVAASWRRCGPRQRPERPGRWAAPRRHSSCTARPLCRAGSAGAPTRQRDGSQPVTRCGGRLGTWRVARGSWAGRARGDRRRGWSAWRRGTGCLCWFVSARRRDVGARPARFEHSGGLPSRLRNVVTGHRSPRCTENRRGPPS